MSIKENTESRPVSHLEILLVNAIEVPPVATQDVDPTALVPWLATRTGADRVCSKPMVIPLRTPAGARARNHRRYRSRHGLLGAVRRARHSRLARTGRTGLAA